MKINVNGITRDMTEEEEKAWKQAAAEMPPTVQTPEQARMDEIEAALIELAAMLTGGM